mgnify:CR=1 FL=1
MIFSDQLNRSVNITSNPSLRIISLVPSQTELLADLNLEKQVVGITKYCVHPRSWWKSKVKIGGTKNINFNKIEELKPNLIIANKEENRKEDIFLLMEKYPVWVSDVRDFNSALEMIDKIGEIVENKERSKAIINKIKYDFSKLNIFNKIKNKVAYLIWEKPIMTINNDTFINDMLKVNGWVNIFADKENRYPVILLDEIIDLSPDILFLSSEPFPYKKKHIEKYQNILPNTKIVIVNGELFSWYGSRLRFSAKYFNTLQKELLFD